MSDRQNQEKDYQAAGFGNRLGFGDAPALLVIDMVEAYFDQTSPLYAGVESARDSTARLVSAARTAGVPVFWTNVVYTPGGADGGYFYKKIKALEVFDRGSPLGAFAKGLNPLPNETVISKQYASAFFGTSLASTLRASGRDTVLITGVTTSGCVRASALDALQNGFIPVVIEDGVGDRDTDIHRTNLFDLAQKYADIVSEEETTAYLANPKRAG